MKADLKEFDIIDLNTFEDATPYSDEPRVVHAQLIIGEEGKSGGDIFNISLINLAWVRKFGDSECILGKRGFHVIEHFNYDRLCSEFGKAIGLIHGQNWNEIVNKLYYFAYWEYE